METSAPFSFEVIGWHIQGWMDIEIDPDRYECKVVEITVDQIDKIILPRRAYLSIKELPVQDGKRVQEFADRWVDDNWHEICRDHAESMRADRYED